MKSQRMCVVCRTMKPKEQLLRVVKGKEGFFIDESYKAQGRGAYICKLSECVTVAQKKNAFERSFSQKIDSEIYNCLKDLICNAE